MADRTTLNLRIFVFALLAAVASFDARAVESKSVDDKKAIRVADAGERKIELASKNQVDEKQEQSVLKMVSEHLPDLKPLLERLRKNDPKQYAVAIRDLARSVRRLESAKKRDDVYFEREVEVVKSQSAVNLLVAKLKVRDSDADRKALRKAVERLNEATIARTQYDVRQLELRLKRAQQQLAAAKARLESKRRENETNLDKSYAGFLRKAGRQDKDPKPKKQTSKAPSR